MFYKIHNNQTGIYTGKYLKALGRVSRYVNNHLLSLIITNTPVFQEQGESGTFCQMRQLMPLLWWHLQAAFNLWCFYLFFIYLLTAGQFAKIFYLMEAN